MPDKRNTRPDVIRVCAILPGTEDRAVAVLGIKKFPSGVPIKGLIGTKLRIYEEDAAVWEEITFDATWFSDPKSPTLTEVVTFLNSEAAATSIKTAGGSANTSGSFYACTFSDTQDRLQILNATANKDLYIGQCSALAPLGLAPCKLDASADSVLLDLDDWNYYGMHPVNSMVMLPVNYSYSKFASTAGTHSFKAVGAWSADSAGFTCTYSESTNVVALADGTGQPGSTAGFITHNVFFR